MLKIFSDILFTAFFGLALHNPQNEILCSLFYYYNALHPLFFPDDVPF